MRGLRAAYAIVALRARAGALRRTFITPSRPLRVRRSDVDLCNGSRLRNPSSATSSAFCQTHVRCHRRGGNTDTSFTTLFADAAGDQAGFARTDFLDNPPALLRGSRDRPND